MDADDASEPEPAMAEDADEVTEPDSATGAGADDMSVPEAFGKLSTLTSTLVAEDDEAVAIDASPPATTVTAYPSGIVRIGGSWLAL